MNKIIKLAVALVALSGVTTFGAPTLGFTETWDAGNGTGGDWQYAVLGDGAPYTLGNVGQTLQLTLPDTTVPWASVYANSGSSGGKFSGDFYSYANTLAAQNTNLMVQFNLASLDNYNTNPGAMVMYFVGNGNTYTLNYNFTQPAPAGSTLYTAYIGGASAWTGSGTFALDFANVTEFGIQLLGSVDATTHRYQLDNFLLTGVYFNAGAVPEPETVWMIVMVLASLGITFRRQLTDVVGQAMARIKA